MIKTMESFTKQELHQNFILIHKFQYPDEPIKQWVLENEDYNGNYHDNWEMLMEVVRTIASEKKMSLVDVLSYFQNEYLDGELNTPSQLYYAVVKEIASIKKS